MEHKLRISQKVEMLAAIFRQLPLRPILNSFTDTELVEAHEFLWHKVVELHFITQKTEFVREQVTKNMVPSATYQHQQGCDLRLDYCKGVECIWSNPVCAGNKVKNNMEAMATVISKYIESAKVMSSVFDQHPQSATIDSWI
ncbi:MAG TPA: hypothetical protein VGA99_02685, partial [bacterium]